MNTRISLFSPTIESILPSYFPKEYPLLVKFLKAYYAFIESSDNQYSALEDMKNIQNIDKMSLDNLEHLFSEVASGIVVDDLATDPILLAKILPKFYKVKGSPFSIEAFFRSYYGITPEVVYPKNNLFTIGGSNIGAEQNHLIQDGKTWQTMSILIKAPIPLNEWKDKYINFCHPAGFWLSGSVIVETSADYDLTYMPISIEDTRLNIRLIEGESYSNVYENQDTKLIIDHENLVINQFVNADMIIRTILTKTIAELDSEYQTIEDITRYT